MLSLSLSTHIPNFDWLSWRPVMLILCVAMVLLPTGETYRMERDAGTCGVEPVVINVSPPRDHRTGCQPTKVMSFGCKGACPAASPFSQMVSRQTSCCKATRMQTQIVHLSCDDGKLLHVPIEHPVACTCQSCRRLSNALEINVLRTLVDDLRTRNALRGKARKFREDLG